MKKIIRNCLSIIIVCVMALQLISCDTTEREDDKLETVSAIKVCFSDTPRNATQSDLKVVLPEEYKEPIRVEYGDTIKGGLPKGEPLNKDDYKFDKWVTYIDGKEVTITDATVFGKSDFSGIQGGEIIIYPVLKNLWVGPF